MAPLLLPQGWLHEYYTSVQDVLVRAKQAQQAKEAVSIGYLGACCAVCLCLAPASCLCVCLCVSVCLSSCREPYTSSLSVVLLCHPPSQYMPFISSLLV